MSDNSDLASVSAAEPPPVKPHGITRYKHGPAEDGQPGGCRCALCRQANADYNARRRAERRQQRDSASFKHGTSAYRNWGCRCDVCVQAWRDYEASPAGRDTRRRYEAKVRATRTIVKPDRRRKYPTREEAQKAGRLQKLEQGRRHREKYRPELRAKAREKYRSDPAAYQRRRHRMDDPLLDQAINRGKEWTGPELELASRADLSTVEVARMLGRTREGVRWARRELIGKDPRKRMLRDGPQALYPPSANQQGAA